MSIKSLVYLLTRIGLTQQQMYRLAAARTVVLGVLNPRFLKGVVIELSTYCNRRCSYCPLCVLGCSDEVMSEEMVDRVADNMAGFTGTIDIGGFYSEPLARLPIVRLALPRIRKAAPGAFLRMYSNGDYLTEELLEELFSFGLDYLYITVHDNSEKRRATIKSWPAARDGRVRVDLARELVLFNRSGYVVQGAVPPARGCVLQFAPVISVDGSVFLCCTDLQGKSRLGNLKTERLTDIARRTYRLRLKILFGGLPTEPCRQCAQPTLGTLPFKGFD